MSLATRLPKTIDERPARSVAAPQHTQRVEHSAIRPVLDEVRRRLSESATTASLTDAALRVRVEMEIAEVLTEPEFQITGISREEIRSNIINEILGFGLLQDLLDDNEISEIMVNGANNVFIESHGVVTKLERTFDSDEQLIAVINRMVRSTGRRSTPVSPTDHGSMGWSLRSQLMAPFSQFVALERDASNFSNVARLVFPGCFNGRCSLVATSS